MTQPTEAARPLLKIKDMALRLGVSRRTIHNWLIAGTCPVAPVPGMKPAKWRAADVDAFERGSAD